MTDLIPLQTNIVATVFGGSADPKRPEWSAYDGKRLGGRELYAALPFRFKGKPPWLLVTNRKNRKSVVVKVRDVGPWNINDDYWAHGRRPQAESGRCVSGPNKGRRTNKAGIDLSPEACKALGITGDPTRDVVDWEEWRALNE